MKKTTMRSEVVDTLSLQELCHFCGADEAWIVELVEYGVIEPRGESPQSWLFRGINAARAKKARRLSVDLGINTPGVAMVLDLLQERDEILRRLARYESV